MHPERELVNSIIKKYRFKGWLLPLQEINELRLQIFAGTAREDSYDIYVRDDSSDFYFATTIFYLQKHYFVDVLNPTLNELVLFELEHGFEWPLQDKFRLPFLSYCHV